MQPYEDIPSSDNMKVLRNVLSIEGTTTTNAILHNNITKPFFGVRSLRQRKNSVMLRWVPQESVKQLPHVS
jgi:hypothetical protein